MRLMLLCLGCIASVMWAGSAEAREWNEPPLFSDIPAAGASETPRFREAAPGEWSRTHVITWNPRYFNATDTRGFDDSFSRRLITSMTYISARYEQQADYRLGAKHWLSFRPTASLAYGYSTMSSHEMFLLGTVDREVDMPSKFDIGQLIGDIGATAGIRGEDHEVFVDWSSLAAWRFQRVVSQGTQKIDPVTGLVDSIRAPTRNEEDRAFFHQTGIGYAFHFGAEPWNYRFAMLWRPVAHLTWQDRSATLMGFGIDMRADGFRLSDDVGLALHLKFDFFLPKDDFNDVFWFELGIGVRFS